MQHRVLNIGNVKNMSHYKINLHKYSLFKKIIVLL